MPCRWIQVPRHNTAVISQVQCSCFSSSSQKLQTWKSTSTLKNSISMNIE